ncbi:MAG: replication restart helicase PriA, partial [Desulfonatronovibrionaceae bacterium]
MKSEQLLWSVALLSPPYKSFTYKQPAYFQDDAWQPGLRVMVPVGRGDKLIIGVLENFLGLDPVDRLKAIHWPLERKPLIDPEFLQMIVRLSSRQAVETGKILARVLPASLKSCGALLGHKDQPGGVTLPACGQDPAELARLATAWQSGTLNFARPRRVKRKIASVVMEPPWPIPPNAKLQWRIMDTLWEQGDMPVAGLRTLLGPSAASSLKSLAAKGLIALQEECAAKAQALSRAGDRGHELSADQTLALERLSPLALDRKFHPVVLHGITGSGKTLVYLELAGKVMHQGRSAIILAPEIAIAGRIFAEARQKFGNADVFLHHGLKAPAEKEKLFETLGTRDRPYLLAGTRSALFMPLKNIGLMVVDEEHDESYKQDQGVIYQAKEIAHYLADRDKSLLVLGSATPDIKTFYAARQNRIGLVSMDSRVGQSRLPSVNFVDLKSCPPVHGPLSAVAFNALKEVLDRGEQAIIMHNRRGYSPVIMCSSCSETARCSQCQVSLTYHKNRHRLVCHYCGKSLPFSIVCSNCRSSDFVTVGQGTEKVEEFLKRRLSDVRVLRLDRDSARNPARTQEILSDFADNKAQVLVGTQMLSKGHTFPNVTLGLVLDGDLGLGMPDYRASERIFQLLVQLSGRSGRGQKPGRVLIQTRNPDHYCWRYVQNCDYAGFFDQEISRRRLFKYPPFVRLGLIRLSFPSDWERQEAFLDELKRNLSGLDKAAGATVMGPAPAPLSRLKNRDRYHLLIKAGT